MRVCGWVCVGGGGVEGGAQQQGHEGAQRNPPTHSCTQTPADPPTWNALMALARCLRGMDPEMKRYPNPCCVRQVFSHSIVDMY